MSPYDKRRKQVLKRLFVALTLFILSFALLFIAHVVLTPWFPYLAEWNPLAWVLLTSAVAALSYPAVDQAYTWVFRQLLFPRRSRIHLVFHRLAEELALITDLRELSNLLVNTLGEVLHLKAVSLMVKGPGAGEYSIASAYGWSVTDYRRVKIQAGNPLLELMRASGPQALLRERAIRALSWQEANTLTGHFEAMHATCILPLWVKTELIGAINLQPYGTERFLDEGDLRFFRDFAQKVALGVRTALLLHELKTQNETLRDRQSHLLQNAKFTAIEQLASGIAHEIHNPLTIISGKAQVLLLQKDRKADDEKVEEVLRTIVKQTRRAADITKKLVMFSRVPASPREDLKLEAILEDTLSLIAYQTSLEGIEIRRRVAPDLPAFLGNVQEIREVFFNLILNALQAVGSGGTVQVGITYQSADKIFVVQVADSGPGIRPEEIGKIFDPFFSTRPEGVGLGLFVTQQIVHRYGGSIRAESQPGEGTLFVAELPSERPGGPRPGASRARTASENAAPLPTVNLEAVRGGPVA